MKNELELIFMIVWLAKKCQVIISGGQALEVLVDRLSSFGPVTYLLFELLHMTAARFSIGVVEDFPDLQRSLRSGEEGLNRV